MSKIGFFPKVRDGGIVLPFPFIVVAYPAWWVMVGVILIFGTGFGIMDYIPIPADMLVATVGAIVLAALALFATLYLVAFQERRSKVLELKANALKNGTPVDEISLEKVKSFHNIYVVALLLGAAITAGIAYVAMISIVPDQLMTVVDGEVVGASMLDYILYSIASVIVAGLVLDRYFVHPIADGTFKKEVLDPLTDSIISKFQEDAKNGTASGLTDDQVKILADALAKIGAKK